MCREEEKRSHAYFFPLKKSEKQKNPFPTFFSFQATIVNGNGGLSTASILSKRCVHYRSHKRTLSRPFLSIQIFSLIRPLSKLCLFYFRNCFLFRKNSSRAEHCSGAGTIFKWKQSFDKKYYHFASRPVVLQRHSNSFIRFRWWSHKGFNNVVMWSFAPFPLPNC